MLGLRALLRLPNLFGLIALLGALATVVLGERWSGHCKARDR
jgi:hypothetical protein